MHNVPRLVNFKLRACARAMVRLSHGVTRVLLALVCTTACELHAQQSRSEEHTSELQSRSDLVCRLLLEKKKKITNDSAFMHIHMINEYPHPSHTTLIPNNIADQTISAAIVVAKMVKSSRVNTCWCIRD